MGKQTLLNLPFLGVFLERQEFEVIGVLQNLTGKIGLQRWESLVKVCRGFALAYVETALDMKRHDIPAPAEFNGLLNVPEPRVLVLHLVQENAVMEPGNLCSNLLHNWLIR